MLKRSVFAGAALVVGLALAWWGGSTIYAEAVEADVHGTRGELTLLPLIALAVGICAILWGVCALAWYLAKALHGTGSLTESESVPPSPDSR